MNVTRLVQGSLTLAGVRSIGLDQASASQAADALLWLNQLLSEQGITSDEIIYIEEYIFPMVIGQEKYSIPNLAEADTVTYVLNEVRYGLDEMSLTQYKSSYRVNNVNSLPYMFYQQRTLTGTDLYFYFKPSQEFITTVNGKFQFPEVNMNTDLNLFIAPFYQTYLMYLLAARMCDWYLLNVPPGVAKTLYQLENKIKSINSYDMSYRPTKLLSRGAFWDWPSINLSPAWKPVR